MLLYRVPEGVFASRATTVTSESLVPSLCLWSTGEIIGQSVGAFLLLAQGGRALWRGVALDRKWLTRNKGP